MLKVPIRFTLITKLNLSSGKGSPSRLTVRPAAPRPAEFTHARNGPISAAAAMAASASSMLETSHLTNLPPISSATFVPRSSLRSATTTFEPSSANCRAQASPIPEAPPVTIEELPSKFTRGIPLLLIVCLTVWCCVFLSDDTHFLVSRRVIQARLNCNAEFSLKGRSIRALLWERCQDLHRRPRHLARFDRRHEWSLENWAGLRIK